MPYGIPGEKPEQTKWMERCVTGVMEGNPDYDKSRAVAICKANLKKNNWKVPKESESELSLREEVYELEKKLREAFMGPAYDLKPSDGPWIEDIYDTYAIVTKGSSCWKVPYTMSGDTVAVDWDNAVKVERRVVWEEAKEEASKDVKVPQVKRINNGRVVTYGGRTG